MAKPNGLSIYIELQRDGKRTQAFRIYPPSLPNRPQWDPYYDDGRGNGSHVGEEFNSTSLAGVMENLADKIVRENF